MSNYLTLVHSEIPSKNNSRAAAHDYSTDCLKMAKSEWPVPSTRSAYSPTYDSHDAT